MDKDTMGLYGEPKKGEQPEVDLIKSNMALVRLWKDGLIKGTPERMEVRLDAGEVAEKYLNNPKMFFSVLHSVVAGLEKTGYHVVKKPIRPVSKGQLDKWDGEMIKASVLPKSIADGISPSIDDGWVSDGVRIGPLVCICTKKVVGGE